MADRPDLVDSAAACVPARNIDSAVDGCGRCTYREDQEEHHEQNRHAEAHAAYFASPSERAERRSFIILSEERRGGAGLADRQIVVASTPLRALDLESLHGVRDSDGGAFAAAINQLLRS